MSFFESGPLPDWKDIQKWLGTEIPWKLAEHWERANDASWLDRYIQSLIKKEKPEDEKKPESAQTQSEAPFPLRTEISKDAKHVTIAVKLPINTEWRALRLYATDDRLKLSGLPNDRKQTIKLPCLVNARSGRAAWKNGRLIVRFRRRQPDQNEVELFIRT